MPTYRSIIISLISQFDILTIPEYAPPSTPNDPFSPSPTLVEPDLSLVSVYIPTYPSSQFWLSYNISPPHPPNALYYFKLFLNGACVASWGCGEEDEYRGKTVFGLFESSESWKGERGVEKRALCFASENDDPQSVSDPLGDFLEVRVYRSNGRKRIMPEIQDFRTLAASVDALRGRMQDGEGGINLFPFGTLSGNHPQRYYKYALLDPLDQPFATFRYYYRTWDQLENLGIISPATSASSSIRAPSPLDRPASPRTSLSTFSASPSHNPRTITFSHLLPAITRTAHSPTPTALLAPPSPPPSPLLQAPLKRLSRIPTPMPAPSIHQIADLLHQSPSPEANKDNSARLKQLPPKLQEWFRCSPSPEKNFGHDDGDAGDSQRPKRSGSVGMLMGVVNNAVKRRGRANGRCE